MCERQTVKTLALIAVCVSLAGCGAAVIAGGAAGSVFYVKGDLEATLENPYENVWDAAHKGLDDLGLTVTKEGKGSEEAEIETKRLDGKKIKIRIKPLTKNTSKINIRIGTFGDEAGSKQIFEAIKSHL